MEGSYPHVLEGDVRKLALSCFSSDFGHNKVNRLSPPHIPSREHQCYHRPKAAGPTNCGQKPL